MFQWNGLRAQRAINLGVESLHHSSDIFINLIVPNPDDAKTFSFQPPCASLVTQCIFVIAMAPAINLDQETCSHASEIGDVRTARDLPAKM
jgi:hypothetical protein